MVDGSGDDNLTGGLGNDTYVLTPGSADVLTESSGTDVLDFSGAAAGIGSNGTPFNLDVSTPQIVFGIHTVQLVGAFENFIGSAFDDFVQVDVNSVTRNINGGVGNDKLTGPDLANTWNITGPNAGNIAAFLNFSNVEFMSSAALGKLIRLHQRLAQVQGKLILCNISKAILEIFVLTKLDKMLKIVKDEATGLNSF